MKKLTNKQLKQIYKTGAFTKSNKQTKFKYNVYFYLLDLLDGKKVHCYSYILRGNRPKYQSITSAFMAAEVLTASGYTVKRDNDVPLGGVLGAHFKLAKRVNASPYAILAQINDAKIRGIL